MLTPYQEEIAVTISAITDEKGFALAGGAALIYLGLVDRHTRDLDFFTSNAGAVNQTCPLVEAALRSNGMEVIRRVDAPGFVRIEVTRGDELCEVDLGNDARLLPVTQTELGRVLATDELAADKMLALFGRAAARDFVDVYTLAGFLGEERLSELAAQKDGGFDQLNFPPSTGHLSSHS